MRDGRHPEPYTVIAARGCGGGRWAPLHHAGMVAALRRGAGAAGQETAGRLAIPCADRQRGPCVGPGAVVGRGVAFVGATGGTAVDHEGQHPADGALFHRAARDRRACTARRPPENQALLDTLAAADAVYIAGEAESHCVLETVEDIVARSSVAAGPLEEGASACRIARRRSCTRRSTSTPSRRRLRGVCRPRAATGRQHGIACVHRAIANKFVRASVTLQGRMLNRSLAEANRARTVQSTGAGPIYLPMHWRLTGKSAICRLLSPTCGPLIDHARLQQTELAVPSTVRAR